MGDQVSANGSRDLDDQRDVSAANAAADGKLDYR